MSDAPSVPFIGIESIFLQIYQLVTGGSTLELYEKVSAFAIYYVPFATLASLLFLTGAIYSIIRIGQLKAEEHERLEESLARHEASKGKVEVTRWQTILTHATSDNPNDWKQAIIDADIILDELLTTMGYEGDGVGEKLKAADPVNFRKLNEAWGAHKVRNTIAHTAGYTLTQHETRRAIELYRQVFEEFYVV